MEPQGPLPFSQGLAYGPNLNQINSLHNLPPCFPNIHFNIIFPSASISVCVCSRYAI